MKLISAKMRVISSSSEKEMAPLDSSFEMTPCSGADDDDPTTLPPPPTQR